MNNIQFFGEKYFEKYLNPWFDQNIQNDWWVALKFFFSHSFMRGRRDKLSNEYYSFTIEVLKEYFNILNENLDNAYKYLQKNDRHFDKECIINFKRDRNIVKRNSIKHDDFNLEIAEHNPIIKLLTTPKEINVSWDNNNYSKEIFLGNDEDIMMVLDVLQFISSDDNKKNIYNYLIKKIKNTTEGLINAYNELINLRAISDKIATFIIRDICLLNQEIDVENYKFAFPVDTWVIKISHKLGCNNNDIDTIKNYLINMCREYNVDPLKVAAGLWYLGFHSLDILIDHYLNIEINRI